MTNNLLITLMVGLLSCHYFTANALIVKRINNGLSNLSIKESSYPHQAQDSLKQIRALSNGKTEINPVSDQPPQANDEAAGLQKQEEISASDTQAGNKHKLLPPQANGEAAGIQKQEEISASDTQAGNKHKLLPPQTNVEAAGIQKQEEISASDTQAGNKHKLLPPQAKQEINNVASSDSSSNNNSQVISNSAPSITQAANHIIESDPESSATQAQQSGGSLTTSTLPSSTPVIGPLRYSMLEEQHNGGDVATFHSPSTILPSNTNPQGTITGSKNDELVLQAASKSIVSPNNLNNDPLKNDPVVKSSLQNSNDKPQTPTGAAENEKSGRSSFNPRKIGDNNIADTVSNQNRINSNGIAIGVSVGMLCLAAALLVGYNYKQSKTSSSPKIPSDVSSIEDNSLDSDPELLDVTVEFD